MTRRLRSVLRPRRIAALGLGAALAAGGWSATSASPGTTVAAATPVTSSAGPVDSSGSAGTRATGLGSSGTPRQSGAPVDVQRLGSTAVDLDGDRHADVLASDMDEDGVPEGLALDTNRDGLTDTYVYDSDENGVPEAFGMDVDQDGWLDQYGPLSNGGTSLTIVPDSPFAPPGPGGLTIGPGDIGITSSAPEMFALWDQMLRDGGTFSPSTAPDPYGFDSYERNSDGDGWSDARDHDPTGYDTY